MAVKDDTYETMLTMMRLTWMILTIQQLISK